MQKYHFDHYIFKRFYKKCRRVKQQDQNKNHLLLSFYFIIMSVTSQKDNNETFTKVEIVVPNDGDEDVESDTIKVLTGLERR